MEQNNTRGTGTRILRILQSARTGLSIAAFVLLSTLIVALPLLPTNQVSLQANQVAPENILSPRRITYASTIETDIAREAAATSADDVYDPPDARVGRQQVLYARQVMEFVNTVRHDTLATQTLKMNALAAINDVDLSSPHANILLSINDSQFTLVSNEISSVLASVMSGEVREGRLDEVSEGLPLLVSVDLPEEYSELVTTVVGELLVPNSIFNAELTEQERAAAQLAVEPVEHTIAAGEVVVRAGEIVTESDIEALQHLGLLQNVIVWQDIVSPLIAVMLGATVLIVYQTRFETKTLARFKNQLLGGGLFLLFLMGARLMVPSGTIRPYLFPAAAMSMLLTAFFSPNMALVNGIVLAALTGLIANNSLELTTLTATGGIIAAISLRRAERINRFFLSGLVVGISQVAVVLIFHVADPASDLRRILELSAASMSNGLLSAGVALASLFVLGYLFQITTGLTLIELERPDHPLLLRLQREAPGTYQHSLQVRNLAEAASEQIGANSLLSRVGALYHDVGKIRHPHFFIENQVEGLPDPHAALDPVSSAGMIIGHVRDGLDLARRYRLPEKIRQFIAEHHGVSLLRPFHHKALEQAGEDESKVNKDDFRYDGPRPQTRESGW